MSVKWKYLNPFEMYGFENNTVDELKAKRRLLLSQHLAEKNHREKGNISFKLKYLCEELYLKTHNPIYK